MRKIRITQIPDGDAPLEIREAWVGIILEAPDDIPRHPVDNPRGIIYGKHIPMETYYQVWITDAITALSEAGKIKEAKWWIEQVLPELDVLDFPTRCCEVVKEQKECKNVIGGTK